MIPNFRNRSQSRRRGILACWFLLSFLLAAKAQIPVGAVLTDCGFGVSATLTNPTCPGNADGSIQLVFTDASQNIAVDWLNVNVADSPILDNLTAGTYLVVLSNADCADTLSYSLVNNPIVAPDLFLTFCSNTAEVNLLDGVTGGTAPYTVSVQTIKGTAVNCLECDSPVVTLDTTSFLQVKITDANGCNGTRLVSAQLLPPLEVSAQVTGQTSCNGDITVTASGGSGNYWYSIDPSVFQSSPVFNNLPCDSTYTITVFDLEGCSAAVSVPITCAPLPTLTATFDNRDVTCFGRKDGRIHITGLTSSAVDVVGYSLGLSSSTDASPVQLSPVFTNLDAGNYIVYVKTDNECTIPVSAQVKIRTPDPLLMAANTTDASCEGENNGEVELAAEGGNGGYEYLISNTSSPTDQNVFADLAPGHYKAQVRDSLGCRDSTEFDIGLAYSWPEVPFDVTPSCYYDSSGSIVIVESGELFIGEVKFSLDSLTFQAFPDTVVFDNLPPGDYTLYIQNEAGCITGIPFTIPASFPPPLSLTISPVSCFGGSDGELMIDVPGEPEGAYQYSLDGQNFTEDPQFTGLEAGLDTLYLLNALGCVFPYLFNIGEPEEPSVELAITMPTCYGYADGVLIATAEGPPEPYTWSIDGGAFQPDSLFEDLEAGNHTLILRDASGCLYPKPAQISQPTRLDAGLMIVPETCGNKNGLLFSTPTGGTPPYQFSWSTGDTLHSYIANLTAGYYKLTLTDQHECQTGQSAQVANESGPLVFATTDDVSCNGEANGAVELVVIGGTPPMAFTWSNGAYSQNLDSLEAGSYIVTVTDIHYCTSSKSVIIHEPRALSLSTQSASYNGLWFINLEVEGGSPPYLYDWSNGETSEDLFNLEPGTYTATVTDDEGCTAITTVDILTGTSDPGGENGRFRAYPNPFGSAITLEWDFQPDRPVFFRVFDANGHMIDTIKWIGGQNQATLDGSGWPSGVYWIRAEDGKRAAVVRVVKITRKR